MNGRLDTRSSVVKEMSLGGKCLPGPKSGSSDKKTDTRRRVNFTCVDVKLDSCELWECFCSLQCIKIALGVHSRTHCKITRSSCYL